MDISELIQKNKSHAIDLSEASDIMPKDLKEHQNRIYNAVLDSEYLSNRHLKDIIDAVIEDVEKMKVLDTSASEYTPYDSGYNQALDDTIKELKAIKELL